MRFNGLSAFWAEAEGRAIRTATLLKTIAKTCYITGFEPEAFGLPVHCLTTC